MRRCKKGFFPGVGGTCKRNLTTIVYGESNLIYESPGKIKEFKTRQEARKTLNKMLGRYERPRVVTGELYDDGSFSFRD
jgi:hypothetical protein